MAYLVPIVNHETRVKISRSARAVLELLDTKRSPLAVRDIRNELPYSERTIHYALRQLRDYSLIEKRANLRDLRESHYLLGARAASFGFSVM